MLNHHLHIICMAVMLFCGYARLFSKNKIDGDKFCLVGDLFITCYAILIAVIYAFDWFMK